MPQKNFAGSEEVNRLIQSQREKQRLSHAYLFLGQRGLGKENLAKKLAQAYLCQEQGEDNCQCLSCRKIEHNNHPDFRIFRRPAGKKELGIDLMREMQRRLAFRPYEGQRRFFIIAEADKMSRAAANSLLKTLESPPQYATLILLAEEEDLLLPTILSRCQQIRLTPKPAAEIKEMLLEQGISPEKAAIIASLSGGNPGKARELAEDNEILSRRKSILDFLSSPHKFSYFNIFSQSKEWLTWQEQDFPLTDLLVDWQRDIMIVDNAEDQTLLINFDYYQRQKKLRKELTSAEAIEALEGALQLKKDIESNVRSDLALQVFLLRLKNIYSGYSG